MFVVGLTGGIGSGKTAASDWFAAQGVQVVDTDELSRQAVEPGSEGLQAICKHFGDWVLTESGELYRSKLREFIFHDRDAKNALEQIVHPEIYRLAKQTLGSVKSAPYSMLVVPLLFEKPEGLVTLCQRTLCIDAPESVQLERAMKRDGAQEKQISAIMKSQLTRDERMNRADDVVDNSGSLLGLEHQLEKLHRSYLKMASEYQSKL